MKEIVIEKIWSEQEKDMNDYDDDVRRHNTAIDYSVLNGGNLGCNSEAKINRKNVICHK